MSTALEYLKNEAAKARSMANYHEAEARKRWEEADKLEAMVREVDPTVITVQKAGE